MGVPFALDDPLVDPRLLGSDLLESLEDVLTPDWSDLGGILEDEAELALLFSPDGVSERGVVPDNISLFSTDALRLNCFLILFSISSEETSATHIYSLLNTYKTYCHFIERFLDQFLKGIKKQHIYIAC